MPQLKFSRNVSFTPQQMLDLVSDLATYPEFVPNCSDMEIEQEEGRPLVACTARMHVKFGPINQSYASDVDIDRDAMTVSATSRDSPFSHLDSQWQFHATPEGARTQFDIDFEFSNRLIAAVAEPAFANIQSEVLDAFIAEAKRRYA